MPPVTPRRTRANAGLRGLPVGDDDLALGDLLEGHRQVVLRAGLHERGRKVVEGALTELVVIVVDLPCALRSCDHEGVARLAGIREELVDPWIHHLGLSLPAICALTS